MAARLEPQPTVVRVKVAATGNLTLSGEQTVDGAACVAGDLVFARAQSTGAQRALYVVQSGAWLLVTPGFSSGLLIVVLSGSALGGKVYRITNDITWGSGTPTIVEDAGASGGSGVLTGGLTLQGATPASAADAVVFGVTDLLGAGTAAEQKSFEGGATLTSRLRAAGTLLELHISEAVEDDATISLPAPSASRIGVLEIYSDPEYGSALIAPDATVTATSFASTNFDTTDTDAKLCVFDGGSTVSLRNRLGSTKWLIGKYRWA